ncbi:hypothetical protein LAZ67_2003261 [Cordylochernes scorpioides]|uniref:Tc1-like transposase DDE domain-containing protein n=1 Tax=Cordylochernes scorpioides TaxID=51811 RepID=A0ABY6K4B1_9ARAC|nr:hypothetical protein LAZ67_2003261 [Cordylochernes scorpioides]
MDDNARPHRAKLVNEYLQSENIRRMDWPARSPDLNPIEHVWDALGRRIGARHPSLRTLVELRTALLEEWGLLPLDLRQSLVNSMRARCETLIAVRGDQDKWWCPQVCAERAIKGVCNGNRGNQKAKISHRIMLNESETEFYGYTFKLFPLVISVQRAKNKVNAITKILK